MSIAEKLVEIAEDMPKVYAAGKQAEYDAFWERFQNGGKATRYAWAFAYNHFNDETYKPKYDIKCSEYTNSGQNVFYASVLTDTKVAIYANSINCSAMFYWARTLKTIRKLVVMETTTFSAAFSECFALEDITFDGVIGQNISFTDCQNLTHASLMSIIEHLGAVAETRTLTLGTANLAKLSDTEKAIATQKGWTLA